MRKTLNIIYKNECIQIHPDNWHIIDDCVFLHTLEHLPEYVTLTGENFKSELYKTEKIINSKKYSKNIYFAAKYKLLKQI